AQAQIRLGAEALPEVSIGVQPLERGNILHNVLEEIWGALGSQAALLALDQQTLVERGQARAQRPTFRALEPTVPYRVRLAELEAANVTRQVLQLLAIEKQ